MLKIKLTRYKILTLSSGAITVLAQIPAIPPLNEKHINTRNKTSPIIFLLWHLYLVKKKLIKSHLI